MKQWLIQCETFFSVDGTLDDYKVQLAVVHFEGKALQWHSSYVKNVRLLNLPSWETYTKILIDRLGEVYKDHMAELMMLRQNNFVQDYHEAFDRIVSQVKLSEVNQWNCFLGSLKQDVHMIVRMFQPTFVTKAFSLAKMYESANNTNSQPKIFHKQHKPPLLPDLPQNLEVNRPKTQTTRSLTRAYMNERRVRGLCYFCDEPFTPAHSLTHKKLQIHVLELDEDNDSDEETTTPMEVDAISMREPLISINALIEVTSF